MRGILLALAVTWPLLVAAELPTEFRQPLSEAPAAEAKPELDPDPEVLEVTATLQGRASYYAGRFHGRRTASGERHDAQALTAAHRSLPFGTWVRVQSLHSGREVNVRINDRGPFIRGRVIDLSRAAAEALDMLQAGTHAVNVQVLAMPKP